MTDEEKREILTKLGLRLRHIRENAKISLRKLETLSEIDFSQIHRIEKGEVSPSITTLSAIAKGLNVKLTDIIDF